MSKLNISATTSCLYLIALLFLFIICVSGTNRDDLLIDQYDNNDGELKDLVMPNKLLLLKGINSHSDHSTMGSDYGLQYGQIRIIPFKKRTIPIELQKALYAHGIVGRRR